MNRKELAIVAVEHGVRWCQNIMAELSGNHSKLIPLKSRDLLTRIMKDLVELHSSLYEPTQDEAQFNLHEQSKSGSLHCLLRNVPLSVLEQSLYDPGWDSKIPLIPGDTFEYERFVNGEKRSLIVERLV